MGAPPIFIPPRGRHGHNDRMNSAEIPPPTIALRPLLWLVAAGVFTLLRNTPAGTWLAP